MALKFRRGNPNHVALVSPADSLDGAPVGAMDSAIMEVVDRATEEALPGAEAIAMALGTIVVNGVEKQAIIGTIPPEVTLALAVRQKLDVYCTVTVGGGVSLYKELEASIVKNSN